MDELAKGKFYGPPASGEHREPLSLLDGRSARRTGRTEQFATNVSPALKAWIKAEAELCGKSQAALLEDMQAAYLQVKCMGVENG